MKNKISLLLSICAFIISTINLIYIMNVNLDKNIEYDVDKTPVYIEAEKEGVFFIPNLNENLEVFNISKDNTALVLSNPENNTYFVKYEIYFKDLNFSIWSNCIAAGKSERIELYDKFTEGTYDIIVKMSFWIDESIAYNGTVYSFDTQLNIKK